MDTRGYSAVGCVEYRARSEIDLLRGPSCQRACRRRGRSCSVGVENLVVSVCHISKEAVQDCCRCRPSMSKELLSVIGQGILQRKGHTKSCSE